MPHNKWGAHAAGGLDTPPMPCRRRGWEGGRERESEGGRERKRERVGLLKFVHSLRGIMLPAASAWVWRDSRLVQMWFMIIYFHDCLHSLLQVSFEDAAAPPPWLQAAVEQGLGEGFVARQVSDAVQLCSDRPVETRLGRLRVSCNGRGCKPCRGRLLRSRRKNLVILARNLRGAFTKDRQCKMSRFRPVCVVDGLPDTLMLAARLAFGSKAGTPT